MLMWINQAYGHRIAKEATEPGKTRSGRIWTGNTRTVRVGGSWSLGRVLMEPLFYNPHRARKKSLNSCWPACPSAGRKSSPKPQVRGARARA